MAKKTTDTTEKSKKKRSGSYNKNRGNEYERKIAKELKELGFNTVTSRSESKRTDDNKIDIIDLDSNLPCFIQLKRTIQTPNYLNIREESSVDNEKFVIIWSKQEKKEVNICSKGEIVLMDKKLFYELIKPYAQGGNK